LFIEGRLRMLVDVAAYKAEILPDGVKKVRK
jgi:hypothetical protein